MVLKTNASHAHTIRKWPEDVDRALDVRAFLHANPRLGGKFHPRYLPVAFAGLENTPQVANTGKYRQIEIFLALKNCSSL